MDELPYDAEGGSVLEVVAAVLAPERRLAPRPRPQAQAQVAGAEPTLVVTVQQAGNLAAAEQPDAPRRRTAEDGTRRRFATIATARRAAMVCPPVLLVHVCMTHSG